MTNPIAFWIIVTIAAALILNFAMGWDAHIFLGRKFLDLIQWIAFWR